MHSTTIIAVSITKNQVQHWVKWDIKNLHNHWLYCCIVLQEGMNGGGSYNRLTRRPIFPPFIMAFGWKVSRGLAATHSGRNWLIHISMNRQEQISLQWSANFLNCLDSLQRSKVVLTVLTDLTVCNCLYSLQLSWQSAIAWRGQILGRID